MNKRLNKKLPDVICTRCGQQIFPLTDSYEGVGDQKHHITCPVSQEYLEAVEQEIAQFDVSTIRSAEIPAIQQTFETRPNGLAYAPPAPRPVFLTLKETAKMLRVSESTIRRYVRMRQLPAKRLPGGTGPGSLLFDERDVLALLRPAFEDTAPGEREQESTGV